MEKEATLSVSLFPTCLASTVCPEVTRASSALLESGGARLRVAGRDSCCGQPAYSAGRVRDARRVAAAALEDLAATSGPIVVPSGSCTAMIRKVWVKLFRKGRERLRASDVASRTFELTEFLVSLALSFRRDDVPAARVTYHDSCHGSRELGLGAQGRELLARAGYEVVECEDPELCCGFGGIFSQVLPEISMRIGKDKAGMLAAAAPVITGTDAACLLHLHDCLDCADFESETDSEGTADSTAKAGSLGRYEGASFRHIAELLAERIQAET